MIIHSFLYWSSYNELFVFCCYTGATKADFVNCINVIKSALEYAESVMDFTHMTDANIHAVKSITSHGKQISAKARSEGSHMTINMYNFAALQEKAHVMIELMSLANTINTKQSALQNFQR